MIRKFLVNLILALISIHDKYFTLEVNILKTENILEKNKESWIVVHLKDGRTHLSHFWGTSNGIMRTLNKMGVDPNKYSYVSISEIVEAVERENVSKN